MKKNVNPVRRAVLTAVALGALAAGAPGVMAQEQYPSKPVKLVVPYPPGGATDVIGRVLAQKLTAALGQQVIVDNRAGAGGSVGAGAVAKSPADGYTLLMGAMTSHSINAALNPQGVPYDIEKSFTPVSMVGKVPLVFVVNNGVKAGTLPELIALAKSKPAGLTFASAGNGSPQHLAGEMFKRQTGIDMLHIPYKGSGPAMTDLIAGQVDVMVETAPAAQSHVKAGKIRALATATTQPVASLPGVPTASQQGLPSFEVHSMFGVAAPAGTPAAIVGRLNGELKKILDDAEVREQLLAQGAEAMHTSAEEASAAIRAEYAKWAKVIREGNIKPE